jgi:hypothetical protein
LLGVARVSAVFQGREEVSDPYDKEWAFEDAACLSFDIIIELNTPIPAPGGLGPWSLRPPPFTGAKKKNPEAETEKARRRKAALTNMMQQLRLGEIQTRLHRVSLPDSIHQPTGVPNVVV